MGESQLPRVRLVSFAGGPYGLSIPRFKRQASLRGSFERIDVFRPRDLRSVIPRFVRTHQGFLAANPRGLGYWLWKPALIEAALTQAPAGTVIAYVDSGCEFPAGYKAKRETDSYAVRASDLGLTLFGLSRTLPEADWSKRDLTALLGLSAGQLESGQIQGGVGFFLKEAATLAFVREWLELAVRDGYHLLDDSPSSLPNAPTFRAHRNDQAILSGLAKATAAEEVVVRHDLMDPAGFIHAARNRGPIPHGGRPFRARLSGGLATSVGRAVAATSMYRW